MKQERVFIGGGMDNDSAIEYIDQRDYLSAWNIRNIGTEAQELGYITSIEGTELIPFTLPAGINKCVGGKAFKELRKAYAFIYNSNQQHLIVEYDFDANSITKIYRNLTDSANVNILTLNPDKYVEDINIVNGELYFLPSDRVPSKANIEKLKSGFYGTVLAEDLSVIKAKPIVIPKVSLYSDIATPSNFIKNNIIKFSYKFIYEGDFESVYSEFTKVTVPPQSSTSADITDNNSLLVEIPVDLTRRITGIIVIANINGSTEWGEIKRLSKENIQALPSILNTDPIFKQYDSYMFGVYKFIFYNNAAYPPVDVLDVDIEYDRVPKYAEAQELLNGNILSYLNIKEGFDNIEVDVDISVAYTDKVQGGTNDINPYLRVTSEYIKDPGLIRPTIHVKFFGVAKTGDKIIVPSRRKGNGTVYDRVYTVPAEFNNNTLGALYNFISRYRDYGFYYGDGAPRIYDRGWGNYELAYKARFDERPYGSKIELATQTTESFTSISTLKLNSSRQYGILYEYPYGRVGGVSTNIKMSVDTFNGGISHMSSPVVTLNIKNNPPQGAIGYYIVSSGQTKIQKSTYMVGKYDSGLSNPDQIAFDVTSLYTFNNQHRSSVVNYSLTKGDRAAFIFYEDNATKVYFDGTASGAPIQDLTVSSFEVAESGGNVKYILKVDKGQLNTGTLAGKNVLVEVYTPNKNIENNLFYTIGERYDIVNGAHSQPTVVIDSGENYIKTRQYQNPQDGNDYNVYVVEDFNYSDFSDTAVTNLGRGYLYNKDFKERHLKTHIRFGDTFNSNTGYNQLNRFKPDNIYGSDSGETTDKYGEGMKMRQRGSSLIVFQELETGYIPVNTAIYEDTVGNSNVAVSEKLLNNIRYSGQGIGIGKATKSFAEKDGDCFFVDPNKSKPVKADRGGVRFITGKMSKFFQSLLQSTKVTNRDIIGYINDFYNEYTLSVESESGIVFQLPMTKGEWLGDNYNVVPSQISVTQPANGTLTYNNTTGIARYTPNTNFVGDDPLYFTFPSVTRKICLNVTAGDQNPDPFVFEPKIDQALSTLISSEPIFISGTDVPAPISITGGEYTLDDGITWLSTPSTIAPSATVRVRVLSSSMQNTSTSTTLTIGNQSATFTVTTKLSVPVCPDRAVVIQICNQNAAKDDNFDIYLNDVLIGSVDLNADAQIGSVFIASLSTPDIIGSDFACPLVGMVNYYFNPSLLVGGDNKINMVNTQNNGNGNVGSVGVRNYLLVGDELSSPCVVADLAYSGSSDANFELHFDYNACCPGDI